MKAILYKPRTGRGPNERLNHFIQTLKTEHIATKNFERISVECGFYDDLEPPLSSQELHPKRPLDYPACRCASCAADLVGGARTRCTARLEWAQTRRPWRRGVDPLG